MQSKFISILVVLVIAVLAVVAVVLYRPEIKEPVPVEGTPQVTDSRGWKVYEFGEVGVNFLLKFSYPPAWGDARAYNIDSEPNEVFPEAKGRGVVIRFSNYENIRVSMLSSDYAAYGNTAYRGELDIENACPKPNIVEQSDLIGATGGVGYCKPFASSQNQYLYYAIGFSPLPEGDGKAYLTQRAILNLNHPTYQGLELIQVFPDITQDAIGEVNSYLMAIQLASAPAALLDRVNQFSSLMLTLEVK